MSVNCLEAALIYLDAGYSVIPVGADKHPTMSTWKRFQSEHMSVEEAKTCWANGAGVALIGGRISRGLSNFDFDVDGYFQAWGEIVELEFPGLISTFPVIQSPKGFGRHVWMVVEDPPGHENAAFHEKGKVAIEIRGEGHYTIEVPTPGYKHVAGPFLEDAPLVDAPTFKRLCEIARSLNRWVGPERIAKEPQSPETGGRLRPGDDYNKRGDLGEVLARNGWTLAKDFGDVSYWARPGKEDRGWSATLGSCHDTQGNPALYVFSANAAPLEAGKLYSKFSAVAALEYEGDFAAAARALGLAGFGSPDPDPGPESAASDGEAQEPLKPKFKITDMPGVLSMPEMKWVVRDVIPAESLGMIFGASGGGKTFLTLDLLMHLTNGLPWRGFDTVKSTCLYAAGEGTAGLARRLRAWELGSGTALMDLDTTYFLDCVPQLGERVDVSALIRVVQELNPRPQILAIDTLARSAAGLEENSAKDMGKLIAGAERLKRELSCTVILVHHAGKNLAQAERGSSALRGAMDFVIQVASDNNEVTVSCEKAKDSGQFKPLKLVLIPCQVGADSDGRPQRSCYLADKPDLPDWAKGGTSIVSESTPAEKAQVKVREKLFEIYKENPDTWKLTEWLRENVRCRDMLVRPALEALFEREIIDRRPGERRSSLEWRLSAKYYESLGLGPSKERQNEPPEAS